jgi:hypothetical protein
MGKRMWIYRCSETKEYLGGKDMKYPQYFKYLDLVF